MILVLYCSSVELWIYLDFMQSQLFQIPLWWHLQISQGYNVLALLLWECYLLVSHLQSSHVIRDQKFCFRYMNLVLILISFLCFFEKNCQQNESKAMFVLQFCPLFQEYMTLVRLLSQYLFIGANRQSFYQWILQTIYLLHMLLDPNVKILQIYSFQTFCKR